MLPIVDKPTLQYIIEEAIESGIEEILIVTGRSKKSIEDHFDRSVELELELEKKGKTEMLKMVQDIFSKYFDHTCLKPYATREDMAKLCEEAKNGSRYIKHGKYPLHTSKRT